MSRIRFAHDFLFMVLISASVSGVAAEEVSNTGAAPTLGESMGHELPLGPDRPFVAPDDRFRLLLPFALAAEPTVDGEQVAFSLDLGTAADVNCFAQLDSLDPATAAAAVGDASLPVGEEGSAIVAREIHEIDLFHVGHEVVVATDWLYRFQQEGGQGEAVGMLKIRSASLALGGVICLHDEVGYSDTLDRIVERNRQLVDRSRRRCRDADLPRASADPR